ncbi:hypothetical protein FAM09_01640 [Niastella caeni]|uniref:Uncharacterized protein n=1 Tax=Niastella caeni TaxID=2569763 RepID=A0A4S8HYI6_9BACT|nr:hypothetical protein [Niastella caeni]THU40843.1 hypothetical protein FAM09_01640 [Niastella caeni]
MKNNSTKKVSQLSAINESPSLRLVYKNEEVIKETTHAESDKKKTAPQAKTPNKLFVKEPLPLFNDYKFKCKDHDPL